MACFRLAAQSEAARELAFVIEDIMRLCERRRQKDLQHCTTPACTPMQGPLARCCKAFAEPLLVYAHRPQRARPYKSCTPLQFLLYCVLKSYSFCPETVAE